MRSLVDKAPASVRWFVLDAGTVTDLDYSAARTVRDLVGELTAKNVGVMFARVNTYLARPMQLFSTFIAGFRDGGRSRHQSAN